MPDILIREITNLETGEVFREQWKKKDNSDPNKKPRDKNFMRCRPQALQAFLEMDIPNAETRVMLWLAAGCRWENQVDVDKAEICRRLSISKTTLWKALVGLQGRDLLIVNNQGTLGWIEPSLCWKGYSEKLPAAIAHFNTCLRQRANQESFDMTPPAGASEQTMELQG